MNENRMKSCEHMQIVSSNKSQTQLTWRRRAFCVQKERERESKKNEECREQVNAKAYKLMKVKLRVNETRSIKCAKLS
jgi:hypothetical protein